ncbi:cobalamin B12-binding domain-containing protein [Candidatus Bathyarchaeota archaeon]|nr:cobalamin B12-binding domain-containing protein [Candidatus Bathyarchaeota archaeon]MBL7080443.1 cobalamin-dependent protein [Candidatus Bathyarchaeota archaeon]
MGSELMNAVIDIRYDEIAGLVLSALKAGSDPLDVLGELREGLRVVGERYQEGEYFLSQLFLAAETMKNALEVLQPLLAATDQGESKGTIVIGSIEGDIHDFGKAIVSSLLTAEGFHIVDLGVDVPSVRFVEEAEKANADVIGISALLSTTQPQSRDVVQGLERRGIRDRFRVILGGTGVVPEYALAQYGVDAAVNDGVEAVKIISGWLEGEQR